MKSVGNEKEVRDEEEDEGIQSRQTYNALYQMPLLHASRELYLHNTE